ncbi:MAG: FAD-binding domain-containing protein [Chitinophagaceae bacterium]
MQFPTDYAEILKRIETVNPVSYGRTRNFIDGDVTYLSPYISRGVISVKQVAEAMFAKGYTFSEMEKFIQQLAWREYFQRTWQQLEDDMFDDIRRSNSGIKHRRLQQAIVTATTGIVSVDKAIQQLYETGYMHNHVRMYVASIACNIGKAYWQQPSQWMYYHLLDGDLASNTCSWQWVAGSFSSKKYYCNQENINRYTFSDQQNTFLDRSYGELTAMPVPTVLEETISTSLFASLPGFEKQLTLKNKLPLLIYNSSNVDPLWRSNENANRVLLIEPSHFKKFPVSPKVLQFILDLSKNIKGIQLFVGEVSEIPGIHQFPVIYSKEHPAFIHYPGKKDERDWLFPEVKGYHKSFFQFWKACLTQMNKANDRQLALPFA